MLTWRHLRACCGLTSAQYKVRYGELALVSPEYRARLSVRSKEAANHPERIAASRQRMKRRWKQPGYAEKQAALANAPESIKKRQATLRKRFKTDEDLYQRVCVDRWTPELRAKQSRISKSQWDDKKDKLWAGQRMSMTKPHQHVKYILNRLGLIEFESEQKIGRFYCDEVDWENKTIVEVNGCYWHGCTRCYSKDDLKRHPKALGHARMHNGKVRVLRAKGWTVIEIWEHDLLDAEEIILSALEEAQGNREEAA